MHGGDQTLMGASSAGTSDLGGEAGRERKVWRPAHVGARTDEDLSRLQALRLSEMGA